MIEAIFTRENLRDGLKALWIYYVFYTYYGLLRNVTKEEI